MRYSWRSGVSRADAESGERVHLAKRTSSRRSKPSALLWLFMILRRRVTVNAIERARGSAYTVPGLREPFRLVPAEPMVDRTNIRVRLPVTPMSRVSCAAAPVKKCNVHAKLRHKASRQDVPIVPRFLRSVPHVPWEGVRVMLNAVKTGNGILFTYIDGGRRTSCRWSFCQSRYTGNCGGSECCCAH